MKYLVTWTARANITEESQARSLQVFSKWQPAEGVIFHQFLGRVDGRGGAAITETDNPSLITRDAAIFGAWFEFEVTPMIDVMELAQVSGDAIGFRESIG